MIKKYFVLFSIIFLFIMCNNEDANICLQTSGTIIKKEILIPSVEKIIVNNQIELFITADPAYKIHIEADENLIEGIDITISENQLEITNHNTCFFYKDYTAKVTVYAPNLIQIRNSSALAVQSIGTLNYPKLTLISENYLSNYLNSGEFNLEINNDELNLLANGASNHKINGFTNQLNINLVGGNPRFDGQNLSAQNAYLFARSSNDILIKVTNEVLGNLYNTGDVLLYKKPNIMSLEAHYTGEIINKY